MNMKFFSPVRLAAGLLGLSLLACQPDNKQQRPAPKPPKNEVFLSPNSPKRNYIKEAVVEPVRRPLMEPVTGKISYDETRTARVSSPIAGRVTGSIATLGAHVKAGDTLAALDSPELGQAQSDYAGATADLKLAERAFQRMMELYKHGIAPRKDQEQAQDSLARARSEAERAKLRLANLGVRTGRTDNRFALQTPIAGVVTERNINPGMEIRPDLADPLFVISDLSSLWVQMDIFEKNLGLIRSGAQVQVRVPAYPNEVFTATVSHIGQVVDEATRTVKVRCSLSNDDLRLLPAMYAAIEVQSAPDDKAVVVPLTALFTEEESDWVYVDIGDYHYQKRPVKAGLRLKDRAVIQEGLNPGEHLVIDGALLLRTEQDSEQQSGEGEL
ncbi:efflux RND transporter periplasmic adaptor subunit [Candidatus Methylobacter oryzae]|uniref:Efflux RND transporter periplasmic adaptor subunit n=1 Tax=Candidatus Methylobacter oryzae TaxID=2497749 RepID=A0ABY3C8P6_9GAMM|nr:efflux RND transporter periplasmic adaptor subunit [Candidatus Methylobacter oryzae]TRW92900.1 efflux RND transporter periplasmic adaptor subunit [Candidatus Methylobacter oryzae]